MEIRKELLAPCGLYCGVCAIRACAKSKGYEGFYQCAEFPCEHIEHFPVPVGQKVILRAVPAWRERGTEKWVEAEEKCYQCPQCGEPLFRGARRCRRCQETVDLE